MVRTDVLVIGSEGAGARAAIAASDHGAEVLVVTKGVPGRCGATITAGADVDIDSKSARDLLGLDGNPADSPDVFFEDMLRGGGCVNNQSIVERHVSEAPGRVKELVDWGMKVAGFLHAPGHRYPRGVYTSGVEMMKALGRQVSARPIKILPHTMITDLVVSDGSVTGAVGIDLPTGEFVEIHAKSVIIATGGAHLVYPVQTAPEELTGDGHGMAFRAGAEFVDMEMVQFLPCTFINPPAWRGVGFPFLIGPEGGLDSWLLNKYGERFMKQWDPGRIEKTTRDKLAIGIMNEVVNGNGSPAGGVYFSIAHLPHNLVDYFATWYGKPYLQDDWTYQGFELKDLMEEMKKGYAVEVGPACHFFIGGIRVNAECETSVRGLFAAGEVAGGTHGANRLSGNACTQAVVQGARAGLAAAKYAQGSSWMTIPNDIVGELRERAYKPLGGGGSVSAADMKKSLQKLAWENAGVLRTGEQLSASLDQVRRLDGEILPGIRSKCKDRAYNREWIECLQLRNMATVLEMIMTAACERTESRGAHHRLDHPQRDDEQWLRNTIIHNVGGRASVSMQPLVITRLGIDELRRLGGDER